MSVSARATEYRICTRCVMDTSDPDITFDESGICGHCRRAEGLLASVQWTADASERALAEVAARMKAAGTGREYDCIIGLSGGVDSSYTAYLAHRLGLRALAVHFDNGWNSELAVENIQKIVETCGFDLSTYVIDWREFRDLQRSFLQASVVDIEMLTDHAIFAALVGLAREHRIGFILSGNNIATEHGLPRSWVWSKGDWKNIRAIHAAYGKVPLRTFPHLSTTRWRVMKLRGQAPEVVELLNLVPYRRDRAAETLATEFGWREYGGKHHESQFTKFYQGVILPTKFGIDKRRVHLSDRLRNGELTRDEALRILAEGPYGADERRSDGDYVRKKLGFDEADWAALMAAQPRSHAEFASDRRLVSLLSPLTRVARRMQRTIAPRAVSRRSA